MRPISFAFFALCAVVCVAPKVCAETSVAPAPQVQSRSVTIQLHNVKPSVMAYWLDSQHQIEPLEMRQQREWLAKNGVTEGFLTDQWFRIPSQSALLKDVKLWTDDSKNSLSLSGEAAAIERVRAAIMTLDKGIPRFEIDARVVQVPIDSPLYNFKDKSLPYVETSWDAIGKLQTAGALCVITTWNMVTNDDIPAVNAISSSRTMPATFQTKTGFHAAEVSVIQQRVMGFRLAVNNNQTVNLFVQSLDGFRLGAQKEDNGRLVGILPWETWQQTAQLKNGSVICFSGSPLRLVKPKDYPEWLSKAFPLALAPTEGDQLLVLSIRSVPSFTL